jgi:hypothetical protein
MTNFEGSSGPCLVKKPCKEKIGVLKIEKILTKLLVGKDKKGFDVIEC